MAVHLRLTRTGRHKRPIYRVVAADSRKPRDGRFLEILGIFDPLKEAGLPELKPERELKRVMAMIDSMTARERRDHTVINGSRKKRIARGSGTNVMEVNRLIKQFLSVRKIAKVMTGAGGRRQLAQLLRSM